MLVTLLEIVPKDAPLGDREARTKIVNEGWDRCLKAKPANLMSADLKTFVKLGNLQDDFGVIAEADWICEAIVENLKIKQDLMARIDEVRKPTGIVTTNTSGIPVAAIATTIIGPMIFVQPYYKWIAVAQVPYLIWVSLATVLQLSITWMNWGK